MNPSKISVSIQLAKQYHWEKAEDVTEMCEAVLPSYSWVILCSKVKESTGGLSGVVFGYSSNPRILWFQPICLTDNPSDTIYVHMQMCAKASIFLSE